MLALVQNRLLEALRAGKPIEDLQKHFRTLERVQKCFLADEKFRHQNDRTQEAYLTHIKHTAPAEEDADYIDHNLEEDPGANHWTVEEFQEDQTQWDRDIEYARELLPVEVSSYSTFEQPAIRILSKRRATDRKMDFLRANKINPAFALPELENPTPASLLALQKKLEPAEIERLKQKEISTQTTPKSPAISSISTNFQSPDSNGNVA
ncbi:MAG TPA: hypothetical protein VF773_19705 [Verrucomicrobiae bacterium]